MNESDEDKGLSYSLRENCQKSFRLADPEFSFAIEAASPIVQNRESKMESSQHPSRKRSNRLRRQSEQKPKLEPEPLSSVSDTTTVRVDRRVIRPDKDPNLLPRRPSSCQHHILGSLEVAMKGQSNGVRTPSPPERQGGFELEAKGNGAGHEMALDRKGISWK